MGMLSNLEPKEVFSYFEEISQVPRPSHKEGKISDYCVEFARKQGLEYYQDGLKNIVMVKEATAGYENVEPVILQGHLDMVCEKEPGREIDFENEGLSLKLEGDYVTAEGTTLGGDDGIALAYALALLSSKSIPHPRLEAVFTVSEEVGMEGATGLDLSMLKGKRLINLDSEEEGYLLTSCAGGLSFQSSLPVVRETKKGILYEVCVSGLQGGHSGQEINRGRANANLLLERLFLALAGKVDYSIASLAGGLKDNAIPREAGARLVVAQKDADVFEALVKKQEKMIAAEYAVTDKNVSLTAKARGEGEERVLSPESLSRVVLLLAGLPNGVQTMSANIEGLVETSLNLGILQLDEKELRLRYAVRSSVQSAKDALEAKLRYITESLGGSCLVNGVYPAWEYRVDSPLRDTMVRVYREMYGKEPVVYAIHAGLECGILVNKIEGLDAVSIGPDMKDIHTTEEKLSISSTRRVWEYLLAVIRQK